MLGRNTLPREELLTGFVRACGQDEATAVAWIAVRKRIAAGIPAPNEPAVAPNEPAVEVPRAGLRWLVSPIMYRTGWATRVLSAGLVVLLVFVAVWPRRTWLGCSICRMSRCCPVRPIPSAPYRSRSLAGSADL